MNKAFFLINEQNTLCSSQSSAYNKIKKLSKKIHFTYNTTEISYLLHIDF